MKNKRRSRVIVLLLILAVTLVSVLNYYYIKDLRVIQSEIIHQLNHVISANQMSSLNFDYIFKNLDLKPNFLKIRLSTVKIKVGHYGGTGAVYKVDKDFLYVLTAKHVINCDGQIDIVFTRTDYSYATVLDISRANIVLHNFIDLAIVKVPKPKGEFTYLEVATQRPVISTRIYTIGHPLLTYYSLNTGIVSNYTRTGFAEKFAEYMMISAPSFSGNSGGPVIDCYSRIVGVVVGITYIVEGDAFHQYKVYLPHMSYAVKLEDIRNLMKRVQ